MKTKEQILLRMLVRAREDSQSMRKRMDNRLGQKADGKPQKLTEDRTFDIDDHVFFENISKDNSEQESNIEKRLKIKLKKFPVYNLWLKNIKGVGEVHASWILSEFDIEEATTVSKMWQYAGYNPTLVTGKKRISKKEYKPSMGRIVSEIKNINTKGIDYIVETDNLIRGDRAMEGFVLPFNKNLRVRLYCLAESFIKCKSPYAMEFYYPYKARLEKESNKIVNEGKPRKDDGKAWNEVSARHRHFAAIRYMMKMFIKDLYVAWREIEGLPVRVPYEEEYLGIIHHRNNKKILQLEKV